jgi:hypothetical protein
VISGAASGLTPDSRLLLSGWMATMRVAKPSARRLNGDMGHGKRAAVKSSWTSGNGRLARFQERHDPASIPRKALPGEIGLDEIKPDTIGPHHPEEWSRLFRRYIKMTETWSRGSC